VSDAASGLIADFGRRGRTGQQSLAVGAIINCTGPAGHVPVIADPLLRGLLSGNEARCDELGLGLDTLPDYRLAGPLADRLFHVGPFLKGQFWEATAVPELREHACRLVDVLLADLANRPPHSGAPAKHQTFSCFGR
jgi:uncharacterized NAD(P)/FAD-binding protein YdhS